MKHQYNQGDLIRYSRKLSRYDTAQLLVITKVFTIADYLYYAVRWMKTGEKETYHINSLDDSKYFSLMARG